MNTPSGSTPSPPFAMAGLVLESLTAHDFERLTTTLEADASMSALLPGGFREWHGASEIGAAFEGWFGNVDMFEVADASVGSSVRCWSERPRPTHVVAVLGFLERARRLPDRPTRLRNHTILTKGIPT